MPDARRLRAWGGCAAIGGGLAWAIKSMAILVTGDQPTLLFEAAPACFGLAAAALAGHIADRRTLVARTGSPLSLLAIVAGLVGLMAEALSWEPATGAGLATAGLATLSALIICGNALRRSPASRAVGLLAMTIGLTAIPALALGGALAVIDERLLELPLLALSLGWIALGISMLRHR
jgi:hypothetical protein